MKSRKPEPGETAWKFILYVLVAIIVAAFCFGCVKKPEPPPKPPDSVYAWCSFHPENKNCAWLLAERDEDQRVATWAERFGPWSAGFLLLSIVASLSWYFAAFSRRAFIGDQFCNECGGYAGAMRVLARLKADNADRMALALTARAFGVDKEPKS